MPARRKRRALRLSKPKPVKKVLYFFIFLFGLLLLLFFGLRSKNFSGNEKTSLVIKNADSSVSVIILDPHLKEIHTLNIPPDTEVEVAGDYGSWKIKSIWQLGEQEGIGGELLSRSVTLGLKMPTPLWADSDASGLIVPGFPRIFNALFSPYKTNLSFADKLGILFLSLSVKNTKRVTIDLEETSYLEKETLPDGEEAFVVVKSPPSSISALFADPILSSKIISVSIKDASEKPGLAEEVGEVVEVLGGKVSSIEKIEGLAENCLLKANDIAVLETLERVFDCKSAKSAVGNFDLEITIGKVFAEKY